MLGFEFVSPRLSKLVGLWSVLILTNIGYYLLSYTVLSVLILTYMGYYLLSYNVILGYVMSGTLLSPFCRSRFVDHFVLIILLNTKVDISS